MKLFTDRTSSIKRNVKLKETDKSKSKNKMENKQNVVGCHYNGKIFTRKDQNIYSLIRTSKERPLFSKLNCMLI